MIPLCSFKETPQHTDTLRLFSVKLEEIKFVSDDYLEVLILTELTLWNMVNIEQEAMIKDSCKVKVRKKNPENVQRGKETRCADNFPLLEFCS